MTINDLMFFDNDEPIGDGEQGVEEMQRFIDHNELPNDQDASDVWELAGEKAGDTNIIWDICQAQSDGRYHDAAELGKELADILYAAAAELAES